MKTKKTMNIQTNQVVSQDVIDAFPQVLIDYIWNLVYSVTASKSTLQIFKLSENQLSGRMVQDIVHMAYDIGFRSTHRIFGITPVNKEILIIHDNKKNEFKMSFA